MYKYPLKAFYAAMYLTASSKGDNITCMLFLNCQTVRMDSTCLVMVHECQCPL